MLYKKIHRQHLREWRLGRKFKEAGNVYKVTSKPRIRSRLSAIFVGCDNCDCPLIFIKDPEKGIIRGKDIEWKD